MGLGRRHCHAELKRTDVLGSLELLGRIPGADVDASGTVGESSLGPEWERME